MSSNKRTVATGPTQNGPVKGPTAAASPIANSNGAKNYFEREKKLFELLSEHVKDNPGKRAYEEIQHELQEKTQEVQNLKTQLETLRRDHEGQLSNVRDELANQKTLVQNLHASHESRIREFDAKSQRDDAELKALSVTTQALQEAREKLNTLNQKKDRLEGECSQLKQKLDKASDEILDFRRKRDMQRLQIDQLNDDLNRSRKTSRDLNEQMGGLPFDKVAIEEEFEKLARKVHNLVWMAFVDRNLRFPDNHNPNFISAFSQILSGIPQLLSNSMPARYMRCALAEAVISEILSTQIFSNRSLTARLKSNGGDDGADLGPMVAGLKMLLSRGYSVEATIIQWQLVKVCQDLKASRRTVSRATQAVCDILDPWLVVECRESPTRDEFADQLTSLFTEAANLWQTLQRTRANATAAVGNAGGEWDYEEDSWPEYNGCEKPPSTPTTGKDGSPVDDHDTRRRWSILTNGHPTSLPVASLFPRILAGNKLSEEHDDDDDNIIFRGYALFPMQRVLLAAREEFAAQQEQQMRTSPPPMTRRNSGVARRRTSRTERPAAPAPLPVSRDDQKVRDRGGPSQQKQAETQLPSVGGGSTKSIVSSRRLSVSSRDGGSHAPPLQQRSAVSESDRGSSTVSISSHRSRR